jgi:16S rRNA (cytosine1402-N4)-methyltransferase
VPVLPAEVLRLLAPAPGQTVVDATLGAGGHVRLLAAAVAPAGRLIGLDRDAAMLALARPGLEAAGGVRVTLHQANFDRLRDVLDELGVPAVDAVLADLGVCSDQLDTPGRGFSFQQEGPLDMRLDPGSGEPAAGLVRRLNERDLADLFWRYGEERFSRRIARRIVEARRREPLATTHQLAELVRRCVPRPRGRRPAIDPATRVFQALRIAVNDELGALERLLAALPDCLKPGGRAAVISFHSLEDRRVKQAFRDRERWEVLTPKPVQATEEEVRGNPRARSAKLRAARRR